MVPSRSRPLSLALGLAGVAVALAGCSAVAKAPRSDGLLPAHWMASRHIPAVVDLAGPRRDGRLTLAIAGRLSLLGRNGLAGFARGSGGYATSHKTEPYIALAPGSPGPASDCSFPRDDLYALQPGHGPEIIHVDGAGRATPFAALPKGSFPDGITFDTTGAFGRRLLVSDLVDGATRILAIDCRGVVRTVTRRAPEVEGGIVVAPASFGIFAGQLIAPDERSGTIYAIDARGVVTTVAHSGLPHGGDIGVESEGFVPAGFSRESAYLADRSVPGNPHPGTNTVLTLAGAKLARAGVRAGDLLVATEGGAETLDLRCQPTCRVRHVAAGPGVTHAEGHIVFAALR